MNQRIGIPYAFEDPDTNERICPVCDTRIPEQYDRAGERLTNHYAEHYLQEHEDPEPVSTSGIRYPDVTVQLTGRDGNAFGILGAVARALRQSGHAGEVQQFMAEATVGGYDELLATCMKWVDVQ